MVEKEILLIDVFGGWKKISFGELGLEKLMIKKNVSNLLVDAAEKKRWKRKKKKKKRKKKKTERKKRKKVKNLRQLQGRYIYIKWIFGSKGT